MPIAVRRPGVVPRDHGDLEPHPLQRGDGRRRGGLGLVGKSQQTRERAPLRHEDGGLPLAGEPRRLTLHAADRSIPSPSRKRRLPRSTVFPFRTAFAPRPETASNPVTAAGMQAFPLRPLQNRPGKGMFGDGLDVEGGLQDLRRRDPGGGEDVRDLRLAPGQGAGLVEDDRPEAVGVLQALPPLDQDAVFRPEPCPDHDRRGGREPQRAGTGDDEDGDKIEQRAAEDRIGNKEIPDREGEQADPEDDGDEDGGDLVRQALDRGLGPLRLLDEADDLRQRRLGADPRRPERETPGPVDRRREDLRPRLLGDRHALPGQHRLVDAGIPGDDDAVRRDLLPGPDDDQIAL